MMKIIELFSGIGSQTQALKNIGVAHEVTAISEIDKYAIKSYEALHGDVNNLGDIKEIEKLPAADLWTYSFPCFTGDTLVLTDSGYKRISEISPGTKVLTHNNEYRPVTAFYNQGIKNIVKFKGMVFDELKCTPNHKFLVRERYYEYTSKKPRKRLRLFNSPEWIEAESITKSHYLGYAINKKSVVPKWNGVTFYWGDGRKPRYKNQLSAYMDNKDFWWIIGRYLGDGWMREQNGIIICGAYDEEREIAEKLDGLFRYSITKERTTIRFHIALNELKEFVSQFGKGCGNFHLTETIIDLPCDLLQSFLDGYFSADGCFTQGRYKATSISRELLYGIGQCIAKVYRRPFSIYKNHRPKKHVIEGRIINQKDTYQITFKKTDDKQDQAFYEDGYIWFPIRSIEKSDQETVYDISVEKDESFTANGAIAHNCTDISVAGKLEGLAKGSGTRSGLLWEVERLLNAAKKNETLPKYLLLENVKNLVSKKFKADFDSWLSFLSSLGYTNYWQVLNAKDYGIPQNRERVFVVSILGEHKPYVFPDKQELKLRLKDMTDSVVEEKFYLKESTIQSILASTYKSRRDSIRNPEGTAACLRARDFREPQCVTVGNLAGGKWDKVFKMSRRVFSTEGLAPTVHCQNGGNTELKIVAIRGRNPENPSDRTAGKHLEQRLEENKQGICNALTTVQKDNLVLEKPNFVARKYGEFIDKKGYIPEMFVAYNKQEIKDIAPTLTTQCTAASGSSAVLKMESEEVKILAPDNWSHKACDGTSTRKRCETDICPTLQANAGQTQQPFLKVKVATKKGYDEATEGDYVNITYPGSNNKRGRVGKGVAHTLTTGDGNAVITENIRIRKLTPRECLRLMGWRDSEIDKIQAAGISATQQYRQAGNGIVIQVLEAIFKALFISE